MSEAKKSEEKRMQIVYKTLQTHEYVIWSHKIILKFHKLATERMNGVNYRGI